MTTTRLEHARPEEWTRDAVARAGVSDIAVREIRKGEMQPEEGLLAAIFASDELLDAGFKHATEELHLRVGETRDRSESKPKKNTDEARARQRAREHDRYHNDPDYRENRLAQMRERRKSPEFKKKEAEQKRRYRARKKVQG